VKCEDSKVSREAILANNGGFGTNILVLDGKNWKRSSELMRSLFGAQDVLELAENGYEDLAANAT